jgi:ferredoxin
MEADDRAWAGEGGSAVRENEEALADCAADQACLSCRCALKDGRHEGVTTEQVLDEEEEKQPREEGVRQRVRVAITRGLSTSVEDRRSTSS